MEVAAAGSVADIDGSDSDIDGSDSEIAYISDVCADYHYSQPVTDYK